MLPAFRTGLQAIGEGARIGEDRGREYLTPPGGGVPFFPTRGRSSVVELNLAKVDVVGSNPIGRSNFLHPVSTDGVWCFLGRCSLPGDAVARTNPKGKSPQAKNSKARNPKARNPKAGKPTSGAREAKAGKRTDARGKAQPPIRVGKSKIHGQGLFATADFPADTLILALAGRPTDEDGEHVIWFHGEDGMEGFEITNEARFVNHARKPNAVFYDEELWTLRAIRRGEEITHDYGEDWRDL